MLESRSSCTWSYAASNCSFYPFVTHQVCFFIYLYVIKIFKICYSLQYKVLSLTFNAVQTVFSNIDNVRVVLQ